MRLRNLISPALYLAALALSGCGGGDGGPVTTAPPATSTVISGLASKGPIKTGAVKVYAICNGAVDTTVPIGQTQTDASRKAFFENDLTIYVSFVTQYITF